MKINAPDINELINNASKFTKKNIIERIKKMIREKYLKLNLAEIKLSKEELMNNIYRNELEKIQQKINVGGLKTRRKMRAEETGEEQFYCSYSEDCNDPKAECDIDLVNVYIKPDGSTRKERIHTY